MRSVDVFSFRVGWVRHQKRIKFWDAVLFWLWLPIAIAVLRLPYLFFNDHRRVSRRLPDHLVMPAIFFCVGVTVVCLLLQLLARCYVKYQKVNDSNYQLALHFMKEMGVPNAKLLLDTHPQYLEAYEKVNRLFTKISASKPYSDSYENSAAHTNRVASLVLRDQSSLAKTEKLMELIEKDPKRSYDSLAEELNEIITEEVSRKQLKKKSE